MNILFLVSSMEGGGAERVAALLCNAWAKRGEQVTLMPTFSRRGGVSYPLSEQVSLEFLADHVAGRSGRIERTRILRRYILASRPDVIISFLPHVNIAALIATVGTGVPVIVGERIYPPLLEPGLPASYRVLQRLFYPRARSLVVQTGGVGAWSNKLFPKLPVHIIPNPVCLPLEQKSPRTEPGKILSKARRILLSVGRLHTQKRHYLLIEAFSLIAETRPKWDLVILGEGGARPELEAQITAFGLAGRVHMPGRVGNLHDWYERADLFCLPSSFEGFPNALLEALAYGIPSIAFDIKTGPREIMDGGRLGLLLPDDRQVDRLEEALSALMDDPKHREALATHGPEVRQTYSMENILSLWDDAISHAIACPGATRPESKGG